MGENTLVTSGIEYSDANTITDYTFQRQHFKKETATHAPTKNNETPKNPKLQGGYF
jgi:hypothetical protein